MYKSAVVFLLALLGAGCQSNGETVPDNPEKWASLRCWYLRDQVPVTKQNLAYIRDRSESGDSLCGTVLGQMYEKGLGVPVDLEKARATYLSAAQSDTAVYVQLGRMAEEGVGEPVNPAKARRLYEQAGAYEDNKLAAVRLAELLEAGRGGPQDKVGALNLYLKWLERRQDDAWRGVQRLRRDGMVLNAEQVGRYNQVWTKLVNDTLTRHMRRTKTKLNKAFPQRSPLKPVKLQFQYSVGSVVPHVTMLEGSGDAAFDEAVMQEMAVYRFPEEPILPAEQKTWRVFSEFAVHIW